MIFELDETLDWHPMYRREWNTYANKDTVTNEDLIAVIQGKGRHSVIGADDSPEFKALRDQLEAEGYIQCQRSWWNGDRVLKRFYLNGISFDPDDQFPSGAAMKMHLQLARRYANV